MKKIILFGMIASFNTPLTAGNCAQTGGSLDCISPTPPRITGPWIYHSATNKTPIEGRATLAEVVNDYFQYNKESNNWDLSLVGSYHITKERIIATLDPPFQHIPINIEMDVHGPFSDRNYEWGWSFYKHKPSKRWECPTNTTSIDENFKRVPPFYCRINTPPRTETCPNSNGEGTNVGNPCSVLTGNKFQREIDWQSRTGDFKFYRTFNSLPSRIGHTPIWTHNFNSRLVMDMPSPEDGNTINFFDYIRTAENPDVRHQSGYLIGEDGSETHINLETSPTGEKLWRIGQNKNIKITALADKSWQVTYIGKKIETYNEYGLLKSIQYTNGQTFQLSYINNVLDQVKDRFGRTLKFNYNSQGLISSILLPNGKQITYQYDTQNRLVNVNRPSYGTKTYHYSENNTVASSGNPNLLTGITDEIGKRYANYAYDAQDRGILTEHANGAQRYTLTYNNSQNSTEVIDPNGVNWTYYKTQTMGQNKFSRLDRKTYSVQLQNFYDINGNLSQRYENGLSTKYIYDPTRNLETSRTEAVGTAQERKIETTWHSDFPKPTEIKESSGGQVLRITTFSYDNNGNALNKTITDPQTLEARTWSYEYNGFGQLTKETNPQG